MNMYSDLFGNLKDYFYDLFFQIHTFVFQVEYWCYDEFDYQLPEEYMSFLIILGMLAVFLVLMVFSIFIFYKAIKFLINIFV